jgi:histidine ammonia-lyase
LVLSGAGLTPADLARIARAGRPVAIAPEGLRRMAAGRAVVEDHLRDDRPVYGLTTGLGSRVTHRLSRDVLADFSRLTILGRSTAVGPPLPPDLVRALMAARLNGLLTGGSGAAPAVAETIAAMLNAGLHPVMPAIGSVGASDLCLMAHLGLAMIGDRTGA